MTDAKGWALEIDADFAEQMGGVRDAVVYLGLQAVSRVDARSPVDTGRFRANWTLTIGAPSGDVRAAVGSWVPQNSAAAEAYPAEGFPAVYLQNNLPYAVRLEDGYSTQAPGGMVALTMAELASLWETVEV
jgi:hypothetical protein